MNTLIPTKKCQSCGSIFTKKQNESRKYWVTKLFCSKPCAAPFTLVHGRKKGRVMTEDHKRKLSLALTGRSGNSGSFKKGQVGTNVGKKFPQLMGEKNVAWKPPIETPCAQCGKILLLKPWQLKNRKRSFCDKACWAKGTRGTGSPVFKGDQAKNRLRQRVMQLPEYVAWRKAVFARDSYRCVWCLSKEKLQADHIQSYAEIVEANSITTPDEARNCSALWEVSNGRTLCLRCHHTTDTYPKNLKPRT